MTRERRLGRGLAALLGEPAGDVGSAQTDETRPIAVPRLHEPLSADFRIDPVVAADASQSPDTGGMIMLNVYDIDDNPFQPRREFRESEIASLAESLKAHEMLQPILVRKIGERYQLISGERRLRAAIQAGWTTIPARLREADDRLVAELAIVENLQRKDLNAIEKALSFRRYLDEHHCTQEELASRLKIDRATISNLMRLLELPDEVQSAVSDGDLSAGHARALLPLGDHGEQIDFCRQIRNEGLSVRDTERQVREKIDAEDRAVGATPGRRRRRTKSDQIVSLEKELRMALGAKVDIRTSTNGRGRVVIHFTSPEDFERLRELFIERGGFGVGEAA